QAEDDVVINEFTVNPAAGKEYVELLVTKPGGVNIQGWTLSDVGTRAGATAATEGDLTLPVAPYLANVPQGTYITIVFTTPAANANVVPEDLSLADGNGRLTLVAGSTPGLLAGGTIDNATADNVHLYAGSRAVGTLIDQVLVGTNASFIAGANWGDNNGATTPDNVNLGVAVPSNSATRFVPTANTLAGFQDDDTGARYVVDAASYGTPGSTNAAVSDSAVTNPTYSTGNVDAGSFNGLNITGNVGLAGNVTVHGTLTIGTGLITTGANTLTIDCGGSVSGASSTTYVNGNLKKNFCATGVKGFEVGTANGYSPVSVNITAGTFPAEFTVVAVQGPHPSFPAVSQQYALQRYWTLTATGVTADLNFNYLDPTDIPVTANENNFAIFKYDGSFTMPGGTVSPGTNEASITGVTSFSDWTLAQPNAPTAADSRVSGVVTSSDGHPLGGVSIRLSGSQNARTITDRNGGYSFSNVESNGFYTVTPDLVDYSFSPSSRSFSLVGDRTDAVFTGTRENNPRGNPLTGPDFFVRQQYLDFLGREPDMQGWLFWTDQLYACGADVSCIRQKRIDISAEFFMSAEFQQGGNFVYRLYRAGLGRRLTYDEFNTDRSQVVGGPELENSRRVFADAFVQRAEFTQKYDGMDSGATFVDALLQSARTDAGVELGSQRDALLAAYNAGADRDHSRSAVLQAVADANEYQRAVYNHSFVVTQYFGYLRRSPDANGLAFWVEVLNQRDSGNYRGMVCSFLTSTEYQRRFSSVVVNNNSECGAPTQ